MAAEIDPADAFLASQFALSTPAVAAAFDDVKADSAAEAKDRARGRERSRSRSKERKTEVKADRERSPRREPEETGAITASIPPVASTFDAVFDPSTYRRSKYASQSTGPQSRAEAARAGRSNGSASNSYARGGGGGGGSRRAFAGTTSLADMPDEVRRPAPVEFKTDNVDAARSFFRFLAGALKKDERDVWIDHNESNRLRRAKQQAQQVRAAASMDAADYLNQIAMQEALQAEEADLEPEGIYVTPEYYTALTDSYDTIKNWTDTTRPIDFFMTDPNFRTKFARLVSIEVANIDQNNPTQYYAAGHRKSVLEDKQRLIMFFKKKLTALEEGGTAFGSLNEYNYAMYELGRV